MNEELRFLWEQIVLKYHSATCQFTQKPHITVITKGKGQPGAFWVKAHLYPLEGSWSPSGALAIQRMRGDTGDKTQLF